MNAAGYQFAAIVNALAFRLAVAAASPLVNASGSTFNCEYLAATWSAPHLPAEGSKGWLGRIPRSEAGSRVKMYEPVTSQPSFATS